MIEIQHLVKRYGGILAVDDISMKLESGKIYGLLGPNGAGKTTTMNMIAGYTGPTAGTVLVDGCDIRKNPGRVKKKIGYLPELPPLYMDMTVEEYLRFAAELKQIRPNMRYAEIKQVMEMTGLEEVRHRLIRNLSKGYRQRAGFAQAILGLPDVIILDEPTAGSQTDSGDSYIDPKAGEKSYCDFELSHSDGNQRSVRLRVHHLEREACS